LSTIVERNLLIKLRNVIETTRFVVQLKHVEIAIARPLMYAGNNSLNSNQVPTHKNYKLYKVTHSLIMR